MFSNKKFGLPESLISSVTEAMKKHTIPKTEKEKDLAALAHPKDKITHKDVMVGRGVIAKEEAEGASKAKEEKFHSKLDKLVHKTFGHSPEEKMKKEEVEEIDEISKKTLGSYIEKASQDKADMANTTGFKAGVKQPAYNTSDESDREVKRTKGIAKAVSKLTKEEVEKLDELSKGTLASYAKKATTDARFKQGIGKDVEALAKRKRDPEFKSNLNKMGLEYRMKAKSREAGVHKAVDRLAKEEVELDEATPTTQEVKQGIGIARDKRYAKGNVTGAVKAMDKINPGLAQHPAVKKELQKQNEEKDTPGNSYEHQCAVHVKHAKLGEGKTLFSQHAEPAEDGSIEWYDVMFEHGIERVETTDIEIIVSESHMNHKKKGK